MMNYKPNSAKRIKFLPCDLFIDKEKLINKDENVHLRYYIAVRDIHSWLIGTHSFQCLIMRH